MNFYALQAIGPLRIRHFIAALPALVLWPVVAFDYRERRFGRRPDRWHWADSWLYRHGFVVMSLYPAHLIRKLRP